MYASMSRVTGVAALVAMVFAGSAARAQTPGGPQPDSVFTISAATAAGYDTDITSRSRNPNADTDAAHTGAQLLLNFSKRTEERNFYFAGRSEYRRYFAEQPINATMYSAASGVSAPLGRRVSFNAAAVAMYSPRFFFSVLPATSDLPSEQLPALDYGITARDTVSYQTRGGLRFVLSPKSDISLSASHGRFLDSEDQYGLKTNVFSGEYTRTLTRYARLYLGYSEHQGYYELNNQRSVRRMRTIDAGINYSRPLSLSRRTTFSFSTGSTAFDRNGRTVYNVIGNARLNHQLARFWNLGVAYSRRVGFLGGFDEPILADAVSIQLGGALGPRALLSANAGYTNGAIGVTTLQDTDHRAIRANVRTDIPITRRRLSAFVHYFYYRYRFGEAVNLPIGIDRELARHGARVGLGLAIFNSAER
jgi:hypothetical protein